MAHSALQLGLLQAEAPGGAPVYGRLATPGGGVGGESPETPGGEGPGPFWVLPTAEKKIDPYFQVPLRIAHR